MKKSSIPAYPLLLRVPIDIKARLDLHLWSDSERCVPYGAYSRFFSERVKEYLDGATLDLNLYGGRGQVYGSKSAIETLKTKLERRR